MSTAKAGESPLTRIILIAAAVIALFAVGLAIWKRHAPSAPAATDQAASAPAGDVAGMISELEAKLKVNPDDAEGWRMLGWAFFETGKFGESATAYGRATQIDPKKADYWSSLGEAKVLAGAGDVPPDAKAAFERAVALNSKDPRARYFLAVAKDISGDHKGAIDDWIALLRDTPPGAPWEADVRRIIGEVATKEKIDVTARMALLRPAPEIGGAAVATAPIPGPSPSEMRAASGMPKGQQDLMIQNMVNGLEAKLKASPGNADGWIMLMRSRMQLGETAKAGTALSSARNALKADPQKLEMINAAANELGVPGR
jgi:cytochrome c-type biogenesis protein CcmH